MVNFRPTIYFDNFQANGLVAGTAFIDLAKAPRVQHVVVPFKILYSQAFRIQLRNFRRTIKQLGSNEIRDSDIQQSHDLPFAENSASSERYRPLA